MSNSPAQGQPAIPHPAICPSPLPPLLLRTTRTAWTCGVWAACWRRWCSRSPCSSGARTSSTSWSRCVGWGYMHNYSRCECVARNSSIAANRGGGQRATGRGRRRNSRRERGKRAGVKELGPRRFEAVCGFSGPHHPPPLLPARWSVCWAQTGCMPTATSTGWSWTRGWHSCADSGEEVVGLGGGPGRAVRVGMWGWRLGAGGW